MKTLFLLLAVAFTLTACKKSVSISTIADALKEKSEKVEAAKDPTDDLPAKYKTDAPVPAPDFTQAGSTAAYQKAIKDAAALLGAQAGPLESFGENGRIKGGVSFDVPSAKIEALLLKAHTNFLARGYYLFRYDQHFGIGDALDKVGLLPTTNKYDVIAAMETTGANWDIYTGGIIAWLKDLEPDQPFLLTGIGGDYLEGRFTTPIKDPAGLGKKMYQFCPDIVDQGVGDMDKLVTEIQKGTLYFWWD